MDQSLEDRIRERAYEIWTAHGRAHGQAISIGLRPSGNPISRDRRRRQRPTKEAPVASTLEAHQDVR